MTDKDDHELVYGLKANEEKYQRLLVDRYAGRLISFVMQRGLSREDAQEVINDTLYKAVRNIDRFDVDKGTKFSNWITTIAIHTAIDRFRKEKNSPIDQSIEEREERGIQASKRIWPPPAEEKTSEIGLLSNDLLKKALKNLSENDQKILRERAYDQPFKKIATLMNKKENAVKVAHHRALKKLKEEFVQLLEVLEPNRTVAALKTKMLQEESNEKAAY